MKSEVAFRQSVLVPQNMENYFAIWKLSVIIKYTKTTEIHYNMVGNKHFKNGGRYGT